jgi:hypothetical protein
LVTRIQEPEGPGGYPDDGASTPRTFQLWILALDFRKKSGSRSYLQHPDGSGAKIIIGGIAMSGQLFWTTGPFAISPLKSGVPTKKKKTKSAARKAAVVTAQILEQLKDYQK